jgi:phospholipase C
VDLQQESTTPAVMFIESGGQQGLDEHPNANIQTGAAYVKSLIDALMISPAWSTSVFVLSYDEGGGQYDHVPPVAMPQPDGIPPQDLGPDDIPGDFNQSGFRVPVTVISPWVKPHFVSHITRDYTAILKMIETRFGLQPLTNRDAGTDDMTEFFDLVPHPTPPLPDQPTNGVCDYSQQNAPGH